MTRWMPEDAAFDILGLSRGLGRDLVAAGLLRPAQDGIFRERDIVEGAIARRVRDLGHRAAAVANAWQALREDGGIDALVARATTEAARDRFEVVVDKATLDVTAALDDEELAAAVRGTANGRLLVVIDLTEELDTALRAFRRQANRGAVPARRRGRPRKTADVHTLPVAARDQ